MANYDLIVIGAGPAGYEAAIRAAQLGKKVACVDKDRYGGTCNNWGCIPTKALLKNAELYHDMKDRAAEFGFAFSGLDFDWSKIVKRSRDVSEKGSAGVNFLFKKNKIDPLRGEASLDKPGEVKVTDDRGKGRSTLGEEHPHCDWLRFAPVAGAAIQWQNSHRLQGSRGSRTTPEIHRDHRRRRDRH